MAWWADSARAVDGDKNGDYWHGWTCTRTMWQYQPWWKVNLRNDFIVDRVVVWNRADCCADRLNDVLVEVGHNDLGRFHTAAACGSRVARPGRMTEVRCGSARGNAVRVSLAGAGILTLCEVEVFGVPVPTASPTLDPTDAPSAVPTLPTAPPVAALAYADVWCGDANLVAGTDTTNREKAITWDTCSSRCTTNANCNYFFWGSVTWHKQQVNRCALFVKCDARTQYQDGNPNIYATQRTPRPTPVPSTSTPSAQPSSTNPTRATAPPSGAPRATTGAPTTQPPRWWFTFAPSDASSRGKAHGSGKGKGRGH